VFRNTQQSARTTTTDTGIKTRHNSQISAFKAYEETKTKTLSDLPTEALHQHSAGPQIRDTQIVVRGESQRCSHPRLSTCCRSSSWTLCGERVECVSSWTLCGERVGIGCESTLWTTHAHTHTHTHKHTYTHTHTHTHTHT
jgi:hypothetical protein